MKPVYFYKDSPYVLTFTPEEASTYMIWGLSLNSYTQLVIHKPGGDTIFSISGMPFLKICYGSYPLPEVISVVKDEVTFTFTPIPVYE